MLDYNQVTILISWAYSYTIIKLGSLKVKRYGLWKTLKLHEFLLINQNHRLIFDYLSSDNAWYGKQIWEIGTVSWNLSLLMTCLPSWSLREANAGSKMILRMERRKLGGKMSNGYNMCVCVCYILFLYITLLASTFGLL